jgi:hypothetical protein
MHFRDASSRIAAKEMLNNSASSSDYSLQQLLFSNAERLPR